MKHKRKIIEINDERCDGCGLCITSCAEGALKIVDGKARLVSEVYCDGLGACLGECPNDALHVVERDAEDFDERAVEDYLNEKSKEEEPPQATMACGCPSSQIRMFIPSSSCQEANKPAFHESAESALTHWPVQIRLVPPTAPFLKNADLLVVADCAPLAYPHFHRDFLKGKVVMMGCPKFDEVNPYIQKFADIFKTAKIKSVTVAVMEVPCCQGLPVILEKGMEMAGKKVPIEKVVISARGEILNREKSAA
ncbi:MAG: 4Fe-4S dicluster domain-containing protein [Pseudomonadota bacterium]